MYSKLKINSRVPSGPRKSKPLSMSRRLAAEDQLVRMVGPATIAAAPGWKADRREAAHVIVAMPTPSDLHPMNSFNAAEPAIVHDRISDRIVTWAGDEAADFLGRKIVRSDGRIERLCVRRLGQRAWR